MAICEFCKLEMNTAPGCTFAKELVYDDGGRALGLKPRPRVESKDVATNGRCFDCDATVGHYHHPGCDIERCIVCHYQALGCDHYFSLEERGGTGTKLDSETRTQSAKNKSKTKQVLNKTVKAAAKPAVKKMVGSKKKNSKAMK
jgi:hypothetical protein